MPEEEIRIPRVRIPILATRRRLIIEDEETSSALDVIAEALVVVTDRATGEPVPVWSGEAEGDPEDPSNLLTDDQGRFEGWVDRGSVTVYVSKIISGEGQVSVYEDFDAVPASNYSVEGGTGGWIAKGTITDINLADDAVTEDKIDDGAVSTSKIQDLAITTDKFGNNTVSGEKLKDGAVTESKLGTAAVTTDKIQNTGITSEKIANNAVTTAKIGNSQVTVDKLADSSVSSAKIVDGTITNADISASAAVAESKLNLASDAPANTPSRRTLGNGPTQAASGNDARLSDSRTPTGSAGGGLTGTYPNPTLASGSVNTAQIQDSAVTTGKIANGAVTEAKIGNSQVSFAKLNESLQDQINTAVSGVLADGVVTTAKIKNDAVTTSKIEDGQVTLAKLANVSAGRILQANSSGAITATAVSGDISLSNTGVATFTGTIDSSKLSSGVTSVLPTSDQKAALAGTAGTVSTSNRYVTNNDSRLTEGSAGTATVRAIGSTGTTVVAGNDSRLIDSRTPSGSAGGDLTGLYPSPTLKSADIGNATPPAEYSTSTTNISATKYAQGLFLLSGLTLFASWPGYWITQTVSGQTYNVLKLGTLPSGYRPSANTLTSGGLCRVDEVSQFTPIVIILATGEILATAPFKTLHSFTPTRWSVDGITFK